MNNAWYIVNLTQDSLFWCCTWIREDQKDLPLPKICHTYPTMTKLGTVKPYLKKIQKPNGQKRYQESATFVDIMQFDKMLRNFFNCTYRGSMPYQLELLNLSPIGHLTIKTPERRQMTPFWWLHC